MASSEHQDDRTRRERRRQERPPGSPPAGSRYGRLTAFETALIAAGVVLFAALLLEMQPFLSPPLVAAAGVLLLWPLRAHRVVGALFTAGGFLLALWLLDGLSGILLPFLVVYLLAYLLNPLVGHLHERFGVSRWISSLATTAVAVALIGGVMLLLVPTLVAELKTLAVRLLASIQHLQAWLMESPLLDQLEATGLVDRQALLDQIAEAAQHQAAVVTERLPAAATGLLGSLGSVLAVVTIAAVMPVVLFYSLKDFPYIQPRIVELFPTWGGRRDYLVRAGGVVGSYLRGQLIISLIGAVILSTAFLLLDVPFGLLLGLLGGLLNLVPSLGAVVTNVIGVLFALVFGDPWYVDAVKILSVLLAYGLFEQSVLTPNILSHHVGLHPVLILLSLFVFGYFLGIFGLFIAVPATALLMTVYKAYRDDWNVDLLGYDRTAHTLASRLRQWREEQKRDWLGGE